MSPPGAAIDRPDPAAYGAMLMQYASEVRVHQFVLGDGAPYCVRIGAEVAVA